jgi:hypothetical protein
MYNATDPGLGVLGNTVGVDTQDKAKDKQGCPEILHMMMFFL